MNTPDSTAPGNNIPSEDPKGGPKVNTTQQEVITNKDEADNITNKDGVVADTEGIEETLSESSPDTSLNADKHITNDDGKSDTTANAEELY